MSSLEPRPAGWYPDPAGGLGQRWHDGQGWTGQISYSKPGKPLGPAFARLGDWVTRLVMFMGVVNLAVLALDLWTLSAPEMVADALAPGRTTLPLYPVVVLFLALTWFVGYLVTGVVWVVWQYQLARSAPTALRRSPGMHVASWCIPFVSYWFPFQNMTDLWRSYGSVRKQHGEVNGPPFLLWWLCWILATWFGGSMFMPILGATVEQVHVFSIVGALGAALGVLSAALAVPVVRELSWQALLAQHS